MVNGNKDDASGYVILRSDRRKNLRNPILVLNIKLESRNKTFFGYAKVIGRGGMFIASVNPRQIGEEFIIEFSLPDKTLIRCKCCVAWRREFVPRSPHEPGMGIKIIDLRREKKKKEEIVRRKGERR